jgi:hypothetical protein
MFTHKFLTIISLNQICLTLKMKLWTKKKNTKDVAVEGNFEQESGVTKDGYNDVEEQNDKKDKVKEKNSGSKTYGC